MPSTLVWIGDYCEPRCPRCGAPVEIETDADENGTYLFEVCTADGCGWSEPYDDRD